MVDSVLAQKAQTASASGRAERVNARGPVEPVRGTSGTGQQAFGASFSDATSILQAPVNDQVVTGNGLLSTSVQIMLAETRSQEAAAPFVAPSKLGQAINVYIETQGQVRETIRANVGGIAANSAVAARTSHSVDILAGEQSIEQSPVSSPRGSASPEGSSSAASTAPPVDDVFDK